MRRALHRRDQALRYTGGTIVIRALLSCGLLAIVLGAQIACLKPSPPKPPPIVFRMGEKVKTGSLIYTVLGSEWLAKLGDGPQARVPAHRFLIVHLGVTNSAAAAASPPALSIIDQSGQSYSESMDGQDVPTWWGIIRNVQPGGTLEGKILFDVEPKTYNLKLEDSAGEMALVELPLHFDAPEPIFVPVK
jgi:hypothetical protein